MKGYIAGKPLLSTTDWPSTVSCAIFFAGCNLRCRFCFNAPILEFDEKFLTEISNVYAEIEAHLFLIEGVIATGGEPTLQPNTLFSLAEWTHQKDLRFGLMTNGTNPQIIRKLIQDNLLDYVAVDIKTVPQPEAYAHITQKKKDVLSLVQETVSLLKTTKISYEFRTTLIPNLIDDFEQIQQIAEWVGTDNYVLQIFRNVETVVDDQLHQCEFTTKQLSRIREFARTAGINIRF
ncbi:MAG: anaerobic ribonucleoside-triphosphate reductase activating protein [Promethearchaeota archaeon]